MSSPEKTRWHTNFGDFANMLKAFIGSNYLSVSFAFLRSGLGLGIGGLVLIASLTDHCCHLLVKTKYHAIKHVIEIYKAAERARPNAKRKNYQGDKMKTTICSNLTDEEDSAYDVDSVDSYSEDEKVIIDMDELSLMEHHMTKHMSYGDVGQICFGKPGLYVVNACIAITQFCFCVAYFIFIGNTIQSLFPYEECVSAIQGVDNNTVPLNVNSTCKIVYLDIQTSVSNKNLHHRLGRSLRDFSDFNDTRWTTNLSYFDAAENSTQNYSSFSTDIIVNYTTAAYTTIIQNITDFTDLSTTFPSTMPTELTTTTNNVTNSKPLPVMGTVLQTTSPSLIFLVASPLPIFIIFALIRSVRRMGWISIVANMCIFVGCVSVLFYIFVDFEVHETVVFVNWAGLPIFFGMVTAAFEGIGLIIPVESSMEGNRHNFTCFLHGAILVLSIILGGFGILGYLRFGTEVHQMVNTNIPQDDWVAFAVNICVVCGVILTFPLQIFPVIEMLEVVLFSEGRVCGPKKKKGMVDEEDEDVNDNISLLPKSAVDLPVSVAAHIPKTVPAWKRNIARLLIVLLACGLAVIFRDSFAYVGAFAGALGSSLLAFILPCLFHLKLCRHSVSKIIVIKDATIVVVGIICSAVSLFTVIKELVEDTPPV